MAVSRHPQTAYRDAHTDPHAHPHRHADGHPDAHRHTYRHTHRHTIANTDRDAHGHAIAHGYTYDYPDLDAIAYCHAGGSAHTFTAAANTAFQRPHTSTTANANAHDRTVANSGADACSHPTATMTTNHDRLLHNEQRLGLVAKWLLLAIGILALVLPGWAGYSRRPLQGVQWLLGSYGVVTVMATLLLTSRRGATGRLTLVYWLSQVADALCVTGLIALSDGLSSPLYLLYPLLALKSLIYVPDMVGLVWLSFLFGPLYVAALWSAHGSLAFLVDSLFLARYLLLLVWTVAVTIAAWSLSGRLGEVDRLRAALEERTRDLAEQTRTLQRTATDLGDRVLELRTLQEVAKALSATLYLNETLHIVADRLQILTGTSCVAVGLLAADGRSLTSVVMPGQGTSLRRRPVVLPLDRATREALALGRSQVLACGPADDGDGGSLAWLAQVWQASAIELIPMVVRDEPIGALLVGLDQPEQANRRQRSLVESFAYFAGTAIENARLYSDVLEKRRELEAVLAGIGDGVLVVDTAGSLVLMNPVAGRIFGLEAMPAAGTPLRGFLPTDDLADMLEAVMAAGQVLVRELPIPSAGWSSDGQPRTFQALAAPVHRSTEAGEQLAGVVTVLRDITAQKELERMKSNFLSVVSHELKTPLHSIKGFVDIILMGKTGPVTELQRDFLNTVREQTGHLQRLIEDLLEFSRLESGQIRLRPVRLAPIEVVHNVVEKLAPLANNKQVALHMEVPAELPQVEADAMRLEQVLTNLVENAIKFTDAGGEVRLRGWDRGEFIELAVIDTGIGIPPEERERVFERFYQVDSSTRRRYKGTGLGLTICKHIVTQHGGRIWVEDGGLAADGQSRGSAFHFTLPKVFPQVAAGEAALDFGTLSRQ